MNDNPGMRASKLPFLQSSKHIEGMDISRLKLQLFEGSSPSVKTKPTERTNPCKQYNSTTDRPKARAYRIYLKSDFLCNLDNDEQDTRKTEERTSCDEKTPIERYIIAEKRRKIRTKEIRDSPTTRKKKYVKPKCNLKDRGESISHMLFRVSRSI